MKPLEKDCKLYCDLYPCNRTECMRRKMIVYDDQINSHIELRSAKECNQLDNAMKWKIYRATRECRVNGYNFKREKLV